MSDVGHLPDLLTDLGGSCSSFVGIGRSAGTAAASAGAAAALRDCPAETIAAASFPPGCSPAPATGDASYNGDGTGTGCAPEAAKEMPAVVCCSTQLDDDDDGCSGGNDDGAGSLPPAGAASLIPAAATRRLASRPHYGGLLYHHQNFPTVASRTKRKVLCAAAASLASPDSLAHEGFGGGKIRVSEERVSRQLQQLRLAGAGSGNVEGSSSGGGVCQRQLPVTSTTIGAAAGAAPPGETLPPAVRIIERTPDRRPGGGGGRSTSASLHPRLPKHRLYDARRTPFASLQTARRASSPGLAPPPLEQLPAAAPSAAAIDAPPRLSPDNFGWSWTERATAAADEMDATATCRAVMLSPPLVVWQSDEKPPDKSSTLGPVEPPRRPSSERRMLTLAAPDVLSRDSGRRGSLQQQLSAEQRAQQPTLQVPANEAERSSSPPPSALINPDEEGVCVVLTVTQCDDTAEADNKLEVTEQCTEHKAADQSMEH